MRRLQLAVVLPFLLFQLQHFENFSGRVLPSIIFAVTLATVTFAALSRGTATGVALSARVASLATSRWPRESVADGRWC